MQQSMGKTEGSVNILAWPGYAEDGSNDPKVDWVTPFEQQTGCKANVKYFGTSDEAVNLMKTGGYDVVSASGDASLRLVASGDVAPVNTALIKDYDQIEPFLKDRPWNSVNGQMYGVPHGWGANLLMYRTDQVKPAPTSWGAVFSDASKYKGKVTAYDSPIYIADAALYLMKTQPDLKITDPYALDQKQLDAAVSLLKDQRQNVSEYWSDYLKEVQAFQTGNSVIGTTWKVIEQVAAGEKVPVKAILPTEGATGWSDTWMISSKAKHPNCAYAWMSYITEPKPQSEVAQYFGEAPANGQACALTGEGLLQGLPRDGQGLRRQDLVLDHADLAVPRRPHRHHVHRLRPVGAGLDRDQGLTLAFSVRRSPGLRTGLLLLPPMLWLGVAYLLALGALFITSLWSQNDFTGTIERIWTLDNYRQIWEIPVYRTIAFRTIALAAVITVVDAVVAFPIALYMAKFASPRGRRLLVIAVLMPLWASYLVKAYAWRGIFADGGLIDWLGKPFGIQLARLRSAGHRRHPRVPLAALHGAAGVRRPGARAGLPGRRLE